MATTPTSHAHHTAPSDLPTLLASWRQHLAAQRQPGNAGHLLGGAAWTRCFLGRPVMPREVIHREQRPASEPERVRAGPPVSAGAARPPECDHLRDARDIVRAARTFIRGVNRTGDVMSAPILSPRPFVPFLPPSQQGWLADEPRRSRIQRCAGTGGHPHASSPSRSSWRSIATASFGGAAEGPCLTGMI